VRAGDALLPSAGQDGDNPMLLPVIAAHRDHDTSRFRWPADKTYSHPSTRKALRARKIPHTIPERSDQISHRKARGSRGGRPPAFDPRTYRERNTVERGFKRLKHWRGIATRYDKYALTHLGGVTLAAIVIYHRTHLPDTT
jgi:transposase